MTITGIESNRASLSRLNVSTSSRIRSQSAYDTLSSGNPFRLSVTNDEDEFQISGVHGLGSSDNFRPIGREVSENDDTQPAFDKATSKPKAKTSSKKKKTTKSKKAPAKTKKKKAPAKTTKKTNTNPLAAILPLLLTLLTSTSQQPPPPPTPPVNVTGLGLSAGAMNVPGASSNFLGIGDTLNAIFTGQLSTKKPTASSQAQAPAAGAAAANTSATNTASTIQKIMGSLGLPDVVKNSTLGQPT